MKTRVQLIKEIRNRCRVDKKNNFKISDYDTNWTGTDEIKMIGEKKLKDRTRKILRRNLKELNEAQELLYATEEYSVLLIFQALDAAGKDGTIKHVMTGINPQGCEVHSFKKPTPEESAHNYLWRYTKNTPANGMIGIFNRSYYEEVLVLKVSPEFIPNQPADFKPDKAFWNERYDDINYLEKQLTRNKTIVLKFFLNVSKDEQKRRFLERLDIPDKHWKFSDSDLDTRAHWDQYQQAFQDAINATSTSDAPWWVIPADNKWIMRAIVSTIVTQAILDLKLDPPAVSAKMEKRLVEARKELENE